MCFHSDILIAGWHVISAELESISTPEILDLNAKIKAS